MKEPVQIARKCIFCATNNANSREHIYSVWMHPELPTFAQQTYTGEFIEAHPKTRVVSEHRKRTKPGHLHTKKIKTVCTTCNNEWMSAIEEAAKPFLLPLIKGEPVTLNEEALTIVARWATLKTIVTEHDKQGTAVTPQADRTAFMKDGTIPPYFNIYLLSHQCPSRAGHVRTSHTIALSPEGPTPPLNGLKKNTQQFSVILGSVMLHVNAARVDNFQIEDRLRMPKIVERRIWPINQSPLSWPATPILTGDQMRAIAYSMEAISASPEARFGGEVPLA